MLKKRFFKTKDECEITFEIDHPGATSAELFTSATGWKPVTMRRVKGGAFRAVLRVPVGARTEFRYRVDGRHWIDDPTAEDRVANRFGTMNCVVDSSRPGGAGE